MICKYGIIKIIVERLIEKYDKIIENIYIYIHINHKFINFINKIIHILKFIYIIHLLNTT
jgi:hypothetical protein